MKKSIISIIIAILFLIALIVINNRITTKAVIQCVENGNDYNFCERTLK